MAKPALKTVHGQPSYQVKSSTVDAHVTRQAGMLGPVTFTVGKKKIQPFSIAPWAENGEKIDRGLPQLLHALRGDFFCLPFGGNDNPWKDQQHPPHGDTANYKWTSPDISSAGKTHELSMRMTLKSMPGSVRKTIRLIDGHSAIYQEHEVCGVSGTIATGHHAMLKLPSLPGSGIISTSPFVHAQVLPMPFENPEIGGYSTLKPDGPFSSLAKVPMLDGSMTDISHYPARLGFDDLVMLVADDSLPFAWTAVTMPEEGLIYFALRNPRQLRSTILWMSNAGRHYHPWNGRHHSVLGIEDVSAYYHIGQAESAKSNPLKRKGFPTGIKYSAKTPTRIPYIMGVCSAPKGFGKVADIKPETGSRIKLKSTNGKTITTRLNLGHLA